MNVIKVGDWNYSVRVEKPVAEYHSNVPPIAYTLPHERFDTLQKHDKVFFKQFFEN